MVGSIHMRRKRELALPFTIESLVSVRCNYPTLKFNKQILRRISEQKYMQVAIYKDTSISNLLKKIKKKPKCNMLKGKFEYKSKRRQR